MRLDRRGRPLCNLIETIAGLHERGIGFRSLTESIDTTTSSGTLFFHIFGALVEFERDLIREPAPGSLVAARARGRTGDWPKVRAFRGLRKPAAARWPYTEGQTAIGTTCAPFGISKSTYYRYVARDRAQRSPGAAG